MNKEQIKKYKQDWYYKNIVPNERKFKYGVKPSDDFKEYSRRQKIEQMFQRPIIRLYAVAKCRAKREKIEFNISKDDLPIPSHCPVLGIELGFNPGKRIDSSYSIDRINPKKGYIKGNVAIISWRANRLKNNLTLEEVESLHEYMKKGIA